MTYKAVQVTKPGNLELVEKPLVDLLRLRLGVSGQKVANHAGNLPNLWNRLATTYRTSPTSGNPVTAH